MKSKKLKVKSKTGDPPFHFSLLVSRFSLPFFFALIFVLPAAAQRVAVLTPDKAAASRSFAEKLETPLSEKLKLVDDSLSESAYLSVSPANAFNLSTSESRRIGSAIGCDFFVLSRSATLRRSSFQRAEYYESVAPVYVVSSRTGRLILWKLNSFEAATPAASEKLLNDSLNALAAEIADRIRTTAKAEIAEPPPAAMEAVPDENSPAAKNFRSPVPYRRIKPDYTAEAALFSVAATVEIEVDLDANGTILKTEVVRWAGFGLDESVEKNVRSMNWRPAERDGKPLPMRFLVRYNFKKLQ